METRKIWSIEPFPQTAEAADAIDDMTARFSITPAIAKLLYMRGYRSVQQAAPFLEKSDLAIHDPFSMKDMDKAAARVCRAIGSGESIAIFGDYDADGVSATALLYLYLKSKKQEGDLAYYIPDRFTEGYGMSRSAIDAIHKHGATLIITVDNGITALEEVAYAHALGIDVVVTDHHECRETLPSALAVVDPRRPDCQYPFSELAGVGVAFKLITAVEAMLLGEEKPSPKTTQALYAEYSDLAMLGTVADVMPVVGENRVIIDRGLDKLRNSPRPGLKALLACARGSKSSNTSIGTSTIGFGIGPRINAAGRMAHAYQALALLLVPKDSPDAMGKAERLAEELCELNVARQREEAIIMKQLDARVEEQCDISEDRVLVIADDEWHPGVIGIAASKVVERFGRPAILITFRESTEQTPSPHDEGRGSGRSVSGVNLIEAIRACEHQLIKCGGHELAAGLSVARGSVDEFRAAINRYVRDHETEDTWTFTTKADMALSPEEITMGLAQDLTRLEPFGIANPVPLFAMSNVQVVTARPIGNGSHLKLGLMSCGVPLDAVMFHAGYEAFTYEPGDSIDMLFEVDINQYNGSRTVQLRIRESRYSQPYLARRQQEAKRYEEIMAGAAFSQSEDILPRREDFVTVYSVLRADNRSGVYELSEKQLLSRCRTIGGVKLRVILDILSELALCQVARREFDLIEFHVDMTAERVDLESSLLLSRLRTQCGSQERTEHE